jgi:hypothetical protein
LFTRTQTTAAAFISALAIAAPVASANAAPTRVPQGAAVGSIAHLGGYPGIGAPGPGIGGYPGIGAPGPGIGGYPGIGYPGVGRYPGVGAPGPGIGGYPGIGYPGYGFRPGFG